MKANDPTEVKAGDQTGVKAGDPAGVTPATVAAVSALYLGNILYAIERCAISLEGEGKAEDAAFYRGIGKLLADERGRERGGRPTP